MAYGFQVSNNTDLESIFIVSGSTTGFGSNIGYQNSSGVDIGTRMWARVGIAGTNNVPHASNPADDTIIDYQNSSGADITTLFRTHNTSCDGLNSATFTTAGSGLLSGLSGVPWSITRRYNVIMAGGGGGGGGGYYTIFKAYGGGGGGSAPVIYIHNVRIYNPTTCGYAIGAGGTAGAGGSSPSAGGTGGTTYIDCGGSSSYRVSSLGGTGGARGNTGAGGVAGSISASYLISGSYLVLAGGAGGKGYGTGFPTPSAVAGANSPTGTITSTGLTLGNSAPNSGGAPHSFAGGGGAANSLYAGGAGGADPKASAPGAGNYGSGGGGGGSKTGISKVNYPGAAGGTGYIKIYWSNLVTY